MESCPGEGKDEEKAGEEEEVEEDDDDNERKRRKQTKRSTGADGRSQEEPDELASKTRNASRKAEEPRRPDLASVTEAEARRRRQRKSWRFSTHSGEHHDQIWNPHGFTQHLPDALSENLRRAMVECLQPWFSSDLEWSGWL